MHVMRAYFLSSDARSGRTALHVLQQAIIGASTRKKKANLFRGDPFNPLVFTEEYVVEITVKDIGRSVKEMLIVRDGNLELTEDELISYQSRAIECVDAVTIEEAREIGEDNGNDEHEGRVMRLRRARRRPHTGDFVYYDE